MRSTGKREIMNLHKITITIPGKPIPLKRSRSSKQTNKHYDPQKQEKLFYGLHMKKQFKCEPLCCPIELQLQFHMPIPSSLSKKKQLELEEKPHTKRVDLDNLIKFTLDAANNILYTDDSLVYSIAAQKTYSKEPKTIITICK